MNLKINEEKLPIILKELFIFYSLKIDNLIISDNKKGYPLNYTESTSIYNFAKYLKEKHKEYISFDWFFEYFNYQFTYWDYWKTQKRQSGDNAIIMANWILGQKALKRFLSKTQKDSYFYHSVFFPKYKIQRQELIDLFELKKIFLEVEEEEKKEINPLNQNEEDLKKRYYNTIEGLSTCLDFTTLFKFNSPLCKDCIWGVKCKNILRQNYNKLYQKRLANKISMQ